MKALCYETAHLLAEFAITMRDVPEPQVGAGDLLVRVRAFSANPVDTKIRATRSAPDGQHVILGWDAAGIVEAVGGDVQGFAVGDPVFYAGDVTRQGSYAELQAVDHRLVARKPEALTFADAAALPLTALTACEALFERGVRYDEDTTVLVIGGAGGVGSIAIQLLKALTPARVIATASRASSIEWAGLMGADAVIGRDIVSELGEIGVSALDVVFGTTNTGNYLPVLPGLMRAFGHFMVIDDPRPFDISGFKQKSLSIHWEYMFAKSMHGHAQASQGALLKSIADLADGQKIRSTRRELYPVDAEHVRLAHAAAENGSSIGKTVFAW